uniref:ULP_PROTEASE domain-containing protein n=1 Tax=Bursaphelenchus xylophilus TaxID=6326 RepID=A0A1I7SC43_BURXY
MLSGYKMLSPYLHRPRRPNRLRWLPAEEGQYLRSLQRSQFHHPQAYRPVENALGREVERQRRIQARWRKIGPLVGPTGSRFQKMRLVQQKNWRHPSTTPAPSTTISTSRITQIPSSTFKSSRAPPIKYVTPSTARPYTAHVVSPAEMAIKATEQTLVDESLATNNIRRQPPARVSAPSFSDFSETPLVDKPPKPARAFGQQIASPFPRRRNLGRHVQGPVLAPLPENPAPIQTAQTRNVLQPTADDGPRIVEDFTPSALPVAETNNGDYHHRQLGMKAEKRFKLVPNRLSYRPRLTIRRPEEDFFTGDSALLPNKRGPTGDGYGPPVFPGQAIPPPVPAVSVGGEAAGIPPYGDEIGAQHVMEVTENTPTTVKPSALLSILNKADEGFNQVISHVEAGTPVEAALVDIMEVALGSQKLDSQAKLLSHVDRTIGLDNLQRLQRWMNTGGAFDMVKEQFAKILQNYKPPPERQITIPPQFEYLLQPERGG